MKKILLTVAVIIGLFSNVKAQSATIANANQEALKNFDGLRGNFLYALNEREKVNVNYEFTPKSPSAVASMMIHTPNPMPFWATITNASGKTVFTWKPEQQVYLYRANWDIAALPAGSYTVNLFMGEQKGRIFHFQFDKK